VFEVSGLLVLAYREVDRNELIGDVALFGYEGHAARARGSWMSVKFECHDWTVTM